MAQAPGVSADYRIPLDQLIELGESIATRKAATDPHQDFLTDLFYLINEGISKSAIGRVCGVGPSTVHYWALGHTPIDPLVIQVIAEWADTIRKQKAELPLLRASVSGSSSSSSLGSLG